LVAPYKHQYCLADVLTELLLFRLAAASSKWVNWEIEESYKRGKGVIGVYQGDAPPAKTPPAFTKNACKTVKWEHAALIKAIEEASTKR
jgi:MTH538 TIR-like domain (DUF1863)